jgi:hypothetical protein
MMQSNNPVILRLAVCAAQGTSVLPAANLTGEPAPFTPNLIGQLLQSRSSR